MVSRIVDDLRDRDSVFRYRWDLYRLLFARTSNTGEEPTPDAWDPQQKIPGLRTYSGEVVKSQGERLIADWLFLNGVDFAYERPYPHDLADATHSQYRPDFYYPQIDAWHEHWALDRNGVAPESFTGYAQQMAWKKDVHRRYGTTLLETTWGGVLHGEGLACLEQDLRRLGVELDWNPERPIRGGQPIRHEDLARLVRTFMTHVKSNSLTREELRDRAGDDRRAQAFLDLYWPIHDEWQARLGAEDCIDFEDMLLQAAEHVEQGRYHSPYELVMVDEFQDASQARARLTRALIAAPGHYLFAVGDDWQSINRFAGADLNVLTDFARWFGPGPTLRLQTTFRCDQAIATAASTFVMKNPRQLPKRVTSIRQRSTGAAITVLPVRSTDDIPAAIAAYLNQLRRVTDPARSEAAPRLSVDILGRYNFDRQLAPTRFPDGLDVRFRTVHAAKGLEADYVVLPNMTSRTYGFPSRIADDPVLRLVMADSEGYPHAEERRLFYVALTRARHGVVLLAPQAETSPFVVELLKDGLATMQKGEASSGAAHSPVLCPTCTSGFLVQRSGRYGPFWGCSAFPRCRHTAPLR